MKKKILNIALKLLFVILLILFPPFGNEVVIDRGCSIERSPYMLKFINHFLIYGYFHNDTILAKKIWKDYLTGIKQEVLIDINKQRIMAIEMKNTFRVILIAKISSGAKTPKGTFIISLQDESRWSNENKCWMLLWNGIGFDYNFGIHALKGTAYERNLGRPVSHGCVRISHCTAEILFEFIQKNPNKVKLFIF